MTVSENDLTLQLRDAIRTQGAMRFDRFMETALFDSRFGYYASGKARIGRSGDFYTNVSVGAFFGRLLSKQFAEVWERLGCPDAFCVVEQGGNDGAFACDVCNGLRNDFPEVYSALRYVLVEPFEALRAAQSHALGDHLARISWVPTLEALPRFSGIHFSNEYADALPVRLFIRQDAQWLERHVDTSDSGDLVWKDLAIQGENLEKIAANLPAEAPPGRIAEWRPLAESWIGDVSEKVERGLILISDYGFPRSDLHAPWRSEGTLSCYTRHRRDADPLVDVGDKDITAHVDFTALARAATSAGCGLAGFTDQHHFLIGLAESWLQQPNLLTAKERNAFRALMHPEMMGTQFKYLGLTKGMDLQNPLAGFRHAGNGIHRVLDQHGDDDASDA